MAQKMQSPEKRNKYRQIIYSLGYVLIWGVILVGINLWLIWPGRPQEIPYSRFLTALEAGRVQRALIGEQEIIWPPR